MMKRPSLQEYWSSMHNHEAWSLAKKQRNEAVLNFLIFQDINRGSDNA